MKIYLTFAIGFLLSFSNLSAQNIHVDEEYDVSRLMLRFVELNKMSTAVSGWRIQLVATTDRRKMERDREAFMRRHPEISIDWQHAKPYYRLRAGAFQTKLEAIRVLHLLKKEYPSAFPAKDSNINPKEFVD